MIRHHLSFSGASLAALASLFPAWLPSQQPLPTSMPRPKASPILPGADSPDGRSSGLWAAGVDYKASFHDGMTFYPQVGPTLPHQPVHWRTTSVRAGGHELLASASVPAPRYDGLHCEYDFGAVVERYDVRDEGLAQSFVVPMRPAAGDLVITGTLTTPLQLPATAPRHGALTLSLPDGRAVVEYGAAFAVDALGRRTPMTTAVEGDRILLRVAAATVAEAAFPLVVDPLFATSALLGFAAPMFEVDVLQETLTPAAQQADLWFAWVTEFAAGDRDLRLWRSGGDWTTTLTEQHREISNWDARHGRLALAPGSNSVVLVYSLDSGPLRFVVAHRHYVTDNFLVTSLATVPQPLNGFSSWRPDVGGRLGATGDRVLITFQREAVSPFAPTDTSTVYATVLDTSITPLQNGFVIPPFVVLPRPNADQERPVVNQAAAGNQWLLAFQELNNAVPNDDWDITTVAIDGNGVVTPTNLDTAEAGTATLHKIDPELSGAYGRYLLTYTTRTFELSDPKPATDIGSAVHAQRIDFDHGTGSGSLPWPAVTLQSLAGNGLANEGLAFDATSRCHWCTGWQVLPNDRYRVGKLGYTGEVVEVASILLVSTSTPSGLATTFSTSPRRFPLVYGENTATPAQSTLRGTFLEYASLTPPALVGVSCGSGVWTGLAATADRQQIGSQAMPLRLTNAPDDSIALLALSTAVANTPGSLLGLDGCIVVPDLLPPNYLGLLAMPIVNGQASTTLDLPPALAPFQLVAQWGYFVSVPTNPLGIQLSEGLTVQVDR